jgi:predicted GNAT family acetyltransferase
VGGAVRLTGRATADVEAWAARVAPLLAARPVDHQIMATVVAGAREGPPAPTALVWVEDEAGVVVAAALRTPPHPLLVSAAPEVAVAPLAAEAAAADPSIEAVAGPEPAARQVAAALARGEPTPVMAQLIQVLAEMAPQPADPPGAARAAREEDRGALTALYAGFNEEIDLPRGDAAAQAEGSLRDGRVLLWDDDGAVSLVKWSPEALGLVRITAVYTPPEHRGRGYAQALVAAAVRRLLAAGADRVMLVTDADDPTPNGVYARVGFRPVVQAGFWSA